MWLFLKNLIFTVAVPGSVAVWIPLWIATARGGTLGGTWSLRQSLAWIPVLVGAGIYLWCVWDFATFGRGTPAPIDAPRRLVVRGLYRYVRNPMYVGVLTMILGWCGFFSLGALWRYLLLVAIVFQLVVLVIEEPMLRRRFGAEYERYGRAVRRWIPGRPYHSET